MNQQSHLSGLDRFCADKLAEMEAKSGRRKLAVTHRRTQARANRQDRPDDELISFSCNDYLGLSQHPDVIAAARDAATQYGTGAGGSRLITGNHPLFAALERKLADIKNTEDCVVFGSGYMANIGLVPALAGAGDLLLVDELAHACLFAGGQLSAAEMMRFKHNDMADLERQLDAQRHHFDKCLILTDGVFSMDGDLAALPELRQLADRHQCWLVTDDAHGLGVIGNGRGSPHVFSPVIYPDIQMGTLSKAVGGYGGYICASHVVCEFLRNRARSFVYSTGLPPINIAVATAALDIIMADEALRERPLSLARLFCDLMDMPPPASPIVPVIIGDNDRALALSNELADAGYLVGAIRPPTVPAGSARLRVTFNAGHDEADIEKLAALIKAGCADSR